MLNLLMKNYNIKQLTKKSVYSISKNQDESLIFVKSNSYMNESVKSWQKFEKDERVKGSLILILYDDFESNLGTVKLSKFKKNESHNGIKNLIASELKDLNCYKLGIGIGPKPSNATRETMASWVLSSFNLDQIKSIHEDVLELLIFYVQNIVESEGITDTNKFNARMTKLWISRNEN
ncbi:unnamed protein product [Candida verbasci]|uniref:Peptidyl-tRNA hydrolase n=1 Tax=Candida verbasci TaxID=1227364 RepID=A0A9W4TUN6_9ASCO|nr:unnamed protein product [Candida verbasci]